MKTYLTLFTIFTSVIMMAVGSYAAENITQFSQYEFMLMATLIISSACQVISIFWIIYTDERMKYRRIIRAIVIVFFIALPALSIYLHNEILTNFSFVVFIQNEILIISIILSLVIFLPGFILTYQFKKEQILKMNKWWAIANGFDINKKINPRCHGIFCLKRMVSEKHFAVEEFDPNFKRITKGNKYQSIDNDIDDKKLIRVRNDKLMGFADREGNIVISIIFDRVSDFIKNHKAIAQKGNEVWTINERGQKC